MTQSQMTPLQQLLASPVRPGKLLWIGLRPAREARVVTPNTADLIAANGIAGDRYETKRNGGRQVTLIATEAIASIASYLGRDAIPPELLRRNLVTQGINLSAFKGHQFKIGPVLLEYSGECAPCSKMESTFGPGGYNAVRGHGGITARILEGGIIRLGDEIVRTT